MASRKLVLEFNDATSTTRKWSFNYAKSDMLSSDVKTLMTTMITNGSIFKYPPVTKKGAQIVVTSETDIDVSD